MAYWIQETANNHNISGYKLFYCDYVSDIDKLPRFKIDGEIQEDDSTASYPCSYGSECVCLENGNKYILGKSTNKWRKVNTTTVNGGSSDNNGSNDGNNIDLATRDDIDKWF